MVVESYQEVLKDCKDFNPQVQLVAVSKKQPIKKIQSLIQAIPGVVLGESFLQEWLEKSQELTGDYKVHFIGNLQSNKIKKIVESFDVIESVGTDKHLTKISQVASGCSKKQAVYLQVNISNDESKAGFLEGELVDKFPSYLKLPNIEILGLMTITKNYEDKSLLVGDFQKMNSLRSLLSQKYNMPLKLSMGMSADYLLALEAGSDVVRVGSRIFGMRD